MTSSTVALAPPTIPSEVQRFAAARGIDDHLTPLVELAQQAFPGARVELSLGQDAEDVTHQYVAIDIEVGDLGTEALVAGQHAWSKGVSGVCPSHTAVYFVLGWR